EFDGEGSRKLRALADHAAACWREADAGLWEMRSEPREHVHGKIMSWVALDRAIRLFPKDGEARWGETRDAIVAEVRARGIDPEGGYLLQALGQPGVADAAVLLAPSVDFPIDDAVLARTVEAVERRLARGPYVLRYDTDETADGLSGEEGGFLICSFWLADALLALGREREARALYETLIAQANDVGLFSEQIDPESGEFLGNFPQAFTHLAVVCTALTLELSGLGGRDAVRGTHADRARRRVEATDGLGDQLEAGRDIG
ncbi:MAG TPA: glycoside hydrolase family 15 protein, partial [Geminicoccaceae bacterium]|nr:glycoside hydrolase family 15 protein [Geminicoccaceae bacterium]